MTTAKVLNLLAAEPKTLDQARQQIAKVRAAIQASAATPTTPAAPVAVPPAVVSKRDIIAEYMALNGQARTAFFAAHTAELFKAYRAIQPRARE